MRPPCEAVVKKSLPVLRSLVAKELIGKYGFSQVEVANKLGMTKAAISQYKSKKRGDKKIVTTKITSRVSAVGHQIAKEIVERKLSNVDVAPYLCKLCFNHKGDKTTRLIA